MKYYIIAGEASGDLHGSNLMKAMLKNDATATFRFWGGDLMQKVGGTMVKHYRDLAFMGFLEVLYNIRTIFKNIDFCKSDIAAFNPDAIIFIDYPGFNMRIAKWAKAKKIVTHYYISPQIWAWKESRITAIKRDFDFLYVILPFEKYFYENKHNFKVHFVGHPLVDAVSTVDLVDDTTFRTKNDLNNKPIIAVLPGSRKQEITKMLGVMLSVVSKFPNYQFVIAGAPSQEFSFYEKFLTHSDIKFVANQTYNLLQHATAALVTSGTATLETALFKVPQVVCYRSSWVSYQIAKLIIKLKYISLVNLIMDKKVVVELIQDNCNAQSIEYELTNILEPNYRSLLLLEYNALENILGAATASEKTAQLIIENTQNNLVQK